MNKPTGPLPYALAAFGVAAALEYPLAKRFPLAKPVPTFNRMLVAGGMAFVGTFLSFYLVSALRQPRA